MPRRDDNPVAGRSFENWYKATVLAQETRWGKRFIAKAGFNPDQPRDQIGRWMGAGNDPSSHAAIFEVQYRGRYHDAVVDELYSSLTGLGSSVLRGVKVSGINGAPAIPDLMVKPAGSDLPYFIEVKTGEDPDFTDPQKFVYPLICLGGHASSLDPRIERMGLKVGELFPPLDIWLFVRGGPGQKTYFENYCWIIRTPR